jgi:transposase InsO family protein
MRAIHSDNGREFKNTDFETFCASLGLEHQFSSLYVPQQNGIVERKNQTLVEMAMTMLDEHRTPRRLWPKRSTLSLCVEPHLSLSFLEQDFL